MGDIPESLPGVTVIEFESCCLKIELKKYFNESLKLP